MSITVLHADPDALDDDSATSRSGRRVLCASAAASRSARSAWRWC